jgi:hypothetical protein
MMTENYQLYAGFYQGLAWTQGRMDAPLTTSIPYQVWNGTNYIDFKLADFFEVVADMDDEGGIHYWEVDQHATTMTIHCTEDHTAKTMPSTAFHSSYWAKHFR